MIKPRSVENFLKSVHLIFNPDKAKGANFAVQFHFKGDENIDAVIRVADGKLQVERGVGEGTDLTVRADSAAWLKFVKWRYPLPGGNI